MLMQQYLAAGPRVVHLVLRQVLYLAFTIFDNFEIGGLVLGLPQQEHRDPHKDFESLQYCRTGHFHGHDGFADCRKFQFAVMIFLLIWT